MINVTGQPSGIGYFKDLWCDWPIQQYQKFQTSDVTDLKFKNFKN